MFTKPLCEVSILRKHFNKNSLRTCERSSGIRHTRVLTLLRLKRLAHILRRLNLWRKLRIRKQISRKLLKPCLTRNTRLRPTLRLIRRIQILEPRLIFRRRNRSAKLWRQFPLLLNRLKYRHLPLSELSQIHHSQSQVAKLPVIKPARNLLSIPRNKRHCRSFIEQFHRRNNLPVLNASPKLPRNLLLYRMFDNHKVCSIPHLPASYLMTPH